MNKERRSKIWDVSVRLGDCKSDLERISVSERDVYDNVPENLQGSRKAYTMEDAIDHLDDAIKHVESAIAELDEI